MSLKVLTSMNLKSVFACIYVNIQYVHDCKYCMNVCKYICVVLQLQVIVCICVLKCGNVFTLGALEYEYACVFMSAIRVY